SKTSASLNDSIAKLSSGLRINKAADDAAGLAISQSLKSQVGGLTVAARNAQDGINVVQTAEGALGESQSILQRLRDLAVQAANDSNNTSARNNIKTESDALVSELGRIASTTNFNGTKLLDGSAGVLNFQVGANGSSNDTIGVDLSGANLQTIASALSSATSGVSSTVTAASVTGAVTFTIGTTAAHTTVTTTLGAAGTYTTTQQVADALNADTSFSSQLTASVDATSGKLVVVSKDGRAVTGGATAGTQAAPGTGFAAPTANAGTGLDYSTNASSQAAINLLDTQISQISTARAQIGAYQNRFTHTINNINVAIQNMTASESQITDTDMASEMVNYTKSQILQQAGTAMLAQANQAPQSILKLLQ
ncbi:flagellin, partial [Mesorhizobium japonicum]|uniref:flagellin N-terminal helical domain-containing protein n=1 Tax=Mesorhizobium japonicum TaxID=2066070 RepID=UPI003B5B9B0D